MIDVLRAFTTAAYAFAAGANDILLVSTVEEALALRQQFPGSLDCFDFAMQVEWQAGLLVMRQMDSPAL